MAKSKGPTSEVEPSRTINWSVYKQQIDFRDGQDLTIPDNVNVILDKHMRVGLLHVRGSLVCGDTNLILRSEGILVSGPDASFRCGSPESPYDKKLRIILGGERSLADTRQNPTGDGPFSLGIRAFVVMDGARLLLFGKKYSIWTKLRETANPGNGTISLQSRVNWPVGTKILVTSTSYDFKETEKFEVVNKSGKTLTLNRPLRFEHWGQTQDLANASGRSWTLDHRAEVAALTRHIVITSEGGEESKVGGHVMVLNSAIAQVSAVEFKKMGQMGSLGRYPFHWHLIDDAKGGFIKHCSIHNSYHRCITVHRTNHAVVSHNVCFNHFGHGIFLEDGAEQRNRFHRNLVVASKRPPKSKSVLFSDHSSIRINAFAPPASYWISNPNNVFTANVAAGGEGTGFWFALLENVVDQGTVLQPNKTDLGQFRDNVAHSCRVGFSVDGAPLGSLTGNPNNPDDRKLGSSRYVPNKLPVFRRVQAYKISGISFWIKAYRADVVNSVFADSLFAAVNFTRDQRLVGSFIVGQSENFKRTDLYGLKRAKKAPTIISGINIYDGPSRFRNVHFSGYPDRPQVVRGKEYVFTPFKMIGAASRSSTHQASGITFEPKPLYRYFLAHEHIEAGSDHWGAAIIDRDGTLTGMKGGRLMPYHPLNIFEGSRVEKDLFAVVGPYEIGNVAVRAEGIPKKGQNFKLQRGDSPVYEWEGYVRRFPTRSGHNGVIRWIPNYRKPLTEVGFSLEFVRPGELSEVIEVDDPSGSIIVSTADALGSLAELLSYQGDSSVWARETGKLYFRVAANSRTRWVPFHGVGRVVLRFG